MTEEDRDELLIQERHMNSFLTHHFIDGTHNQAKELMDKIDDLKRDVEHALLRNHDSSILIHWKRWAELPLHLRERKRSLYGLPTGVKPKGDELQIYDTFSDIQHTLESMRKMIQTIWYDTYVNDTRDRYLGGY